MGPLGLSGPLGQKSQFGFESRLVHSCIYTFKLKCSTCGKKEVSNRTSPHSVIFDTQLYFPLAAVYLQEAAVACVVLEGLLGRHKLAA